MQERYQHKYPYDWRTKKPTIFRTTEQWFASVEGFRNAALDAAKAVEFVPSAGANRLMAMVEGRSDWCISRQRKVNGDEWVGIGDGCDELRVMMRISSRVGYDEREWCISSSSVVSVTCHPSTFKNPLTRQHSKTPPSPPPPPNSGASPSPSSTTARLASRS